MRRPADLAGSDAPDGAPRTERPGLAASSPAESSSTVSTDHQIAFVERLVAHHATVDGDVVQLAEHTFALHGSLAVDGETILAEYRTEHEARAALARLADRGDHVDHP